MTIKKGDKVKAEYEGKLEDGTVFDSSERGESSHPIEFEVGVGQVIRGFDEAVIGMKEGEEKEIEIPASEAYGEKNEGLKQKVPRKALPEGQEPKVGMMLMISSPDGRKVPVRIEAVDKENITVDLNHPLAGKKLIFKIKIAEIKKNSQIQDM